MTDNLIPINNKDTDIQAIGDAPDNQAQTPPPATGDTSSQQPLSINPGALENPPSAPEHPNSDRLLTDQLTDMQDRLHQLGMDVAKTGEQLSYLPGQIRNLGGRIDAMTVSISESRFRSLLLDLLGIFDLVDQLIRSVEITVSGGNDQHLENYRIIRTQISQILRYNGLEEIQTEGVFLADIHRAVDRTPCTEAEQAGKIVKVVRPGFQTAHHVLRYAEVVVSHHVPSQEATQLDTVPQASSEHTIPSIKE
jgi:molecular chaperone GrpE (heat shock protein)